MWSGAWAALVFTKHCKWFWCPHPPGKKDTYLISYFSELHWCYLLPSSPFSVTSSRISGSCVCVCMCLCMCTHVFFGFLTTECVVKLSRKKASGSHSLQSAANSETISCILTEICWQGWLRVRCSGSTLPVGLCELCVCVCVRACARVCLSVCLLEAHGHWGGVIGPCSFPCSILQVSCKFPTCMYLPS